MNKRKTELRSNDKKAAAMAVAGNLADKGLPSMTARVLMTHPAVYMVQCKGTING
jgi:hypothetical protein